MKHSKQLLVFDWDGTLMDSQAKIVSCFRTAIEEMGMEKRSHEQLSNVIGLGFREALLMLYQDDGDDFHFRSAFRAHKRVNFVDLCQEVRPRLLTAICVDLDGF